MALIFLRLSVQSAFVLLDACMGNYVTERIRPSLIVCQHVCVINLYTNGNV